MSELNKNDLKTSLSTTNSTGKTILKSDSSQFSKIDSEANRVKYGNEYIDKNNSKEIKIIDSKGNIRTEKIDKNQIGIELNPGESIIHDEPKIIKIHFELSEEDYNRLKRYIPNNRIRHEIARLALLEMINRKEGRDKKLQSEKLIKDAAYIQQMIDQGLIKISEDKK